MINDRTPKLPKGIIRLMQACINDTVVAAPIFLTNPKAISGHIIKIPPATDPAGMYKGPVSVATNG